MRAAPTEHALVLGLVLSLCCAGACSERSARVPPAPGEMVLIPAGPFWMGTRRSATPRKTRRRVHLRAYELDRTEVTIGQFARFVEATGHKAPFVPEAWATPYNWAGGRPPRGYDDHPVTLVNWHDAAAYCRWAGKRLPSEAEWEKGARGSDGRRFPWGDTWDGGACNHGRGGPDNYDDSDGYETTAPVGAFPRGRSPYGLEDMFGNAWEWTADWYSETWDNVRAGQPRAASHEPRATSHEPLSDPRGPPTGYQRVVRGGSFFFNLKKDWTVESMFMFPGTRRKSTGFRCARSLR